MTIKDSIETFVARLTAAIEADTMERARASVLNAFGLPVRRGPGRPRKVLAALTIPSESKARRMRRKRPRA